MHFVHARIAVFFFLDMSMNILVRLVDRYFVDLARTFRLTSIDLIGVFPSEGTLFTDVLIYFIR